MRGKIIVFKQGEDESLYNACERYKKVLKRCMSNTISTVFILSFSHSSSFFTFSLYRIGSFDFLFCFYALEGCSMFLAPFLSVFGCLEDIHI